MTFEVDTSSLESTIRNMETELENIQQIRTRLYTALEELDGMWEGQAHDVFAIQYTTDQSTLQKMCQTISDAIEGLDAARKEYNSCEQSVKNKISRITI